MATKRKKAHWFTYVMATLGGLCVLGAAAFSVMWCVPSIHDKIWQPTTDTTTEDTTNTEGTTNTDE